MSAVNDPTPPAAPQPIPPADAPPIPLPPRPRLEPITPEELGRAMTRLDRMLVGLVLVLTALLAVFPIRNSDFWLHLATARDWLGNKFSLGQDPYSYTGSGTWVNHSWLYDLLVYGLFQAFGGPGVVIVKAALLLALVIVMLSIRRRGQSLWLPGVCTAVAVLAMSPRFLMQPEVVSFVLLGVTLLLLMRRDLRPEPEVERKRRAATPVPWLGERADRPLWLLVPLFALWVNLDAWFVLGPLAVALYLAGSLIEAFFAQGKPNAPRPGAWRPLAAVLAAGVLACLQVNPFGYHALVLPGEIGARGVLEQLGDDETFARLLSSPLQREYFTPEQGLNIAGMAYFPLVLLGLVSFVLTDRVRRAALWGGFLVLSLAHARAIPFFAIVAAPVAALNFQEYAARRFGTAPVAVGWLKEWSLAGRGLSVLAAFGLALLAWPGWLFALPMQDRPQAADERRVGLGAEPPPGLVKLAAQLDEWHRDGTLTDDDHGLNLQPDAAGALAWLCTEYRPKCFFDYRFENYSPEVAGEYVELRGLFDPASDADPKTVKTLFDEAPKWRPILTKRRVTYVIASDGARGGFLAVRKRCAGIEGSPALVTLYQDGHAAVFVPRQTVLTKHTNEYLAWLRARGLPLPSLPPPTEASGRFKGKEFDAWALAFGPKVELLPDQKPRPPQSLPWYVRFAFGSGARPAEVADAAAFRAASEDNAFRHHYQEVMRPEAARNFGSVAALGGVRTGNLMADACIFGVPFYWVVGRQPPRVEYDEMGPIFIGPSAPLMLAVRSARRAILQNPQDAEAYFQLALAYLALTRQSDEHQFGSRMPLLVQVRQVQTIAALRNAVLLNPDHVGAHFYLTLLFERAHFADLQLKHLGEELRAIHRAPPQTGEELMAFQDRYALGYRARTDPSKSAEALKLFQEQLKKMEEAHTKLEKTVKDNLNTYAVRSEKKRVMDKARIALELHLGEKALQVLLDSDALEFGKEGAQLELELLMQMGELDKLRVQLAPENEEKLRKELPENLSSLGAGAYELYRTLLAAGEGNYKEADDFLKQAEEKAVADPEMLKLARLPVLLSGSLGSMVLRDPALVKRLSRELSLTDDAGPAKDLDLHQLTAIALAQAIAENAPEHGPAVWLLVQRLLGIKRLTALPQMVRPLAVASDFEIMRGLLKVETGDIAGAKRHLCKALYGQEEPADLGTAFVLDFPGVGIGYRYLKALEKKE